MNKSVVIRNATVVDGGTSKLADIVVEDGRIAEIGPGTSVGGWVPIMDATGLVALPGFVDIHVHFNEPGRADWEGLESGSRALAMGGGTTFCDMPLNSDPPVLYAEALTTKRRIAEKKSVADFALWGGLCPGFTDEIPRMADAGAAGFKAFMCPSGIAEFPHADAETLKIGMAHAAEFGLPVSVHAEDPAVIEKAAAGIRGTGFQDFLASRPKDAEVSAIRIACDIAGETGAALHVVHVSCREGLEVIAAAKRAGVDVTAETCPHYLLFDTEAALAIGAPAKCAPPLRPPEDVTALWSALADGLIDTIGSDHSPAPPSMKTGEDFFRIWGGISGCQHGLVALAGEFHHRHPERIANLAAWFSEEPAQRLNLGGKGRLIPGHDGDVVLVSFEAASEPVPALYRHKRHLYERLSPRCRVHHVIRRGEFLVRDGVPNPNAGPGKFLEPER